MFHVKVGLDQELSMPTVNLIFVYKITQGSPSRIYDMTSFYLLDLLPLDHKIQIKYKNIQNTGIAIKY